MDKIFLSCTVVENRKYYSFTEVIKSGENLVDHLSRHKGLIEATVCKSRKNADELTVLRRTFYKANGCYMFSETF